MAPGFYGRLKHTVTDLRNDATYVFQVRAVAPNPTRTGDEASADPRSPVGVPESPVNLTATPGDRSIGFSWGPPPGGNRLGDLPLLQYEYRFVPDPNPDDNVTDCSGVWVVNGKDTSVTVTETNALELLMNGRQYCFSVQARNEDGDGGDTGINATPVGPPLRPSNLVAEARDSVATLMWDAPTELEGVSTGNGGTDILRYEYRGDDSGTWIGTGLHKRVVVPNLTNGRRYAFEVRAVNAQGAGEAAAAEAVKPLGGPSRPRELAATPGHKQVTLRWQQPANNGGSDITGYQYRVDGGAWSERDPGAECNGDRWPTVRIVTNGPDLTNGQRYRFEVRAVNEKGAGDAEEVTATPVGPPSAPLSPSAVPGDGLRDADLGCRRSEDGGAAIVRYEYCTGAEAADCVGASGTWISVGQNLRASVTGLKNGQSVQLQCARGECGELWRPGGDGCDDAGRQAVGAAEPEPGARSRATACAQRRATKR